MATQSHSLRRFGAFLSALGTAAACAAMAARSSHALAEQPKQLVKDVVWNEQAADKADHSRWIYRDHDQEPGKNTVQIVVETADGEVKKTIENDGQPLNGQQEKQDEAKMRRFASDPELQEKQRQDNQQDEKKANALMAMLPDAFLWTQTEETDDTITLAFRPNPAFEPPTRDARVFAAMAGKMVVDKRAKRLRSLSGTLTAPVAFGWGLLGRLQKGGTFRVERREVGPGIWRTTATHIHINGRALIFKTIQEQEDEESSHFKPAPASLSLAQAIQMLISREAEKDIGG